MVDNKTTKPPTSGESSNSKGDPVKDPKKVDKKEGKESKEGDSGDKKPKDPLRGPRLGTEIRMEQSMIQTPHMVREVHQETLVIPVRRNRS